MNAVKLSKDAIKHNINKCLLWQKRPPKNQN